MVMAVIEHVEYPFAKGVLTADGIQWSAEQDTGTAEVDVAVEDGHGQAAGAGQAPGG